MKKPIVIIIIIIAVIAIGSFIAYRVRTSKTVQNPVNVNPNPVNPPDYTTETQTGYNAFFTSCMAKGYGNSDKGCNQAWCIAQNKGLKTWAEYKLWWNNCAGYLCWKYPAQSGCDKCIIPTICKS